MPIAPQSEFLRVVHERGFVHQVTDLEALDKRLMSGVTPAYIGFDCTADSLHAGSLMQIMLLRWFQRTGHKPIVLMGGGTTKVGDPSGKDDARKLLSEDEIERNMAGIKSVFAKFLSFDAPASERGANSAPTDAIMANNAEWLDRLLYIPLLRDIGRHFSVNRMLSMESVKLRLERDQPLSFLEFNYMVLQSYDFVELAKRYGCALQMGGSDQWGNIVMGAELGRRVAGLELFGLTSPLLATSSGAKMGKTAQGAVWLNADRVSPYDYYQYWRNTEDADVGRFLKLFTELPLGEIARLEALSGAEVNEAKKVLAFEATKLCHGEAAAHEAAETARRTFEEGATGDALPTMAIPAERLKQGVPLYQLLVEAKVSTSNGEARRLIQQGGARVDDEVIRDPAFVVRLADAARDTIKLTAGKKRHALVRAV